MNEAKELYRILSYVRGPPSHTDPVHLSNPVHLSVISSWVLVVVVVVVVLVLVVVVAG